MADDPRAFYDGLASDYHLLFADWRASAAWQAGVLGPLIRAELGEGVHTILDCACGIGTQAIGLAALGYRVHGTDLSGAAVERARAEARTAGVAVSFGVADMRELGAQSLGAFDAVLACDNALPHLLTDDTLDLALQGMHGCLRAGGLLLASIRDYDRLAQERPRTEGPRVIDDAAGRRIAFQVWDWEEGGERYLLHQFIVRQAPDGWQTIHHATTYRALRRAGLSAALARAGFRDVRWLDPDASGYYQPIVMARR